MFRYTPTLIIFLILLSAFSSCKKNNPTGGTQNQEPPSTPPVVVKKLATANSVLVLKELYTGTKEAKRLAQNNPASDFSPTGFYFPPGGTVTINLTAIKGNHKPVLLVGTYSRYNNKWNPTSYTLNAGTNNITDPLGGIMYIRFGNDFPDSEVSLKFVSGFKPIPFFQSGKFPVTI